MKTSLVQILLAAFLVAGCHASESLRSNDGAGSAATARIFLAVQKTYPATQPVTVKAVLANAGDSAPLMYAIEHYHRVDWEWRVSDEHGTIVRRRWEPTIFSHASVELAPGAARVDEFDLREIYDLKPGRYTVSVQKRVWLPNRADPLDVQSAEFAFELLP